MSILRRGRARGTRDGDARPDAPRPRRRRLGGPLVLITGGIFLLFFGSGHAAPPVVATSGSALAYNENGPATSIDTALTITEPDTDNIAGATVQITSNYVSGEDVLSAPSMGGVTSSFDSGTGAVTLTGDADVATYETAIRAITYTNTSDNPSTATRTITILVTDINAESGSNTRDITITPSDDALTFTTTAGSLAYTENNGAVAADSNVVVADPDTQVLSATVQVTGNYVNGEDTLGFVNQLGITGSWNAGTGTMSLSGAADAADYQTALRAVTYANGSNNPSTLPRTLTYTVHEAGGINASGTRVVAITAVNDPPDPGGDTTVGAPGGGGASILEDAPAPGAANVRLTVPQLTDAEGPAPNQVRVISVTGGALTQGNGAAIGLGTGGSLLALSGGGVDLRFTPDANRDTDASFTYVVVDGANPGTNSTASTATIPITPVNDAPVLTASGGSAAFVENGGGVAVDPGVTLSDIDDTNLEGATVQITGNYAPAEDTLAFTNGGGVSGSWDAGTGTLTLSGPGSVATYESALRSVTYANSSENPAAITRTVSYTVNDGTDPSGTGTRGVTVTAVNDTPTATASGYTPTYNENGPAVAVDNGIVLADPDSPNLASATVTISGNYASGEDVLAFADQSGISGSWNAGSGTLSLSGSASLASYQSALRSITYVDTDDDPSTATRTISFVVDDGAGASAPTSQSLAVVASNDPPLLSTGGGGITYTENDVPVAIAPGLTVADLDSANLAGATVQVSANYWNGEDVLAFTNQPGITGSWDATTGTLSLSGSAGVAAYEAALQSVTYQDTSDDPTTVTRTVSFVVDDGSDSSNTDTRTVSVTPVNDLTAVSTSAGTVTFTEGDPATTVDGGLTVNELDDPTVEAAQAWVSSGYQPLEERLMVTTAAGVTADWDGATGTLDFSGTASAATYETILRSVAFRNTSDDPTTGNRVVSFRADDGAGWGAVGTRTVSVAAVDDPPTARDDSASVLQPHPVTVDVLANDTDPDDPSVDIASVGAVDNATVSIKHHRLRVVPDPSFSGRLRFTYTAIAGGQTDTASVTVDVAPSADLAAKVSAGPSPAYTGDTVTAFANVSNAGPGVAEGTTVVVDMDGATVTNATTAGGSCTHHGDTARCAVPDVAKGGTALVSVAARAASAGTMDVRASVSSDATDIDPHDDSATATVGVLPAPGIVFPPPTTPPVVPPTNPSPVVRFPRLPSSGGGHSGGGGSATATTTVPSTTTSTPTTSTSEPDETTTTPTTRDRAGTPTTAGGAAGGSTTPEPQNSPVSAGFIAVLLVSAVIAAVGIRRLMRVR